MQKNLWKSINYFISLLRMMSFQLGSQNVSLGWKVLRLVDTFLSLKFRRSDMMIHHPFFVVGNLQTPSKVPQTRVHHKNWRRNKSADNASGVWMVRKDSNTLIKLNVKMGNFVMITVDMVFFFSLKCSLGCFCQFFFLWAKRIFVLIFHRQYGFSKEQRDKVRH